ncbi:DUF4003 family protein [Ureibacillus sp. NPDC094379]
MNDEQFSKQFQANYDRVINYIGQGNDQHLVMSLASKYTINKKQFSGVMLRKVMEIIDEEKSFSLQLESAMSYKLASYLMEEKDIHTAIKQINYHDSLLADVKFKQSPFRILGALFLQEDSFEHAKRAKNLFDEMNRKQPFLTSKEDIPYVVVQTSIQEDSIGQRAETIQRYYLELKKHQFTIGNHLQGLSQIMTIYSTDYNELLVQYIIQLRKELIKQNIKVKRVHYPFIGILALAATDNLKIGEICILYQQLMEQKAFRYAKEYALIVAIQKVVNDLLNIQNLVDLTPLTRLSQMSEIAEFVLEFTGLIPSGVSDVLDFFN